MWNLSIKSLGNFKSIVFCIDEKSLQTTQIKRDSYKTCGGEPHGKKPQEDDIK
jgi:hypothetical protein